MSAESTAELSDESSAESSATKRPAKNKFAGGRPPRTVNWKISEWNTLDVLDCVQEYKWINRFNRRKTEQASDTFNKRFH